jgi:diguanylate cyclase (GGDEF)-like protein
MSSRRLALVVIVPVLVIAGAVFLTGEIQRNAASLGSERQVASQQLLTAMLDQETGARGYFQTRRAVFLQPWSQGTKAFSAGILRLQDLFDGDPELTRMLVVQDRRGLAWHARTAGAISTLQETGRSQADAAAGQSKITMDKFRVDHAALDAALSDVRSRSQTFATAITVGVAGLLAIALSTLGLFLARRLARREMMRQRDQSELREQLQVSESEQDSRIYLIRHVERLLSGARAAVFNRNNSDDRLEITREEGGAPSTLDAINPEALRPRSCMAVRLSRPYRSDPGSDALSSCDICGALEGAATCEPLLVGGQVIGSVLVVSKTAIKGADRAQVRESVSQAAPILDNQRNLALAEVRAASDALTGLPNRRAADDTLKRMVMYAGRSVTPLAAILLDLDHFKRLNDQHGHETGDEALALVGRVISSTVRASDFAARFGGEEFLVLLPDTDQKGAMALAEKLRIAIERAEMPNVGVITASLGVAVLPGDATDATELLRKADRGLYSAKQHGRNQVQRFTQAPGAVPPPSIKPRLPAVGTPG